MVALDDWFRCYRVSNSGVFHLIWGQRFRSGIWNLTDLDLESCGNSCYGAWSTPEIFVLWPWYEAPNLWHWYRVPQCCFICPWKLKAGIGSLSLFLQTRNERHREAFVPQGPAWFYCVTKYHRLGGFDNRNLFSTVQEAGSSGSKWEC